MLAPLPVSIELYMYISHFRSWFTKAEHLRLKQEAIKANRAQTTESSQHKASKELQTASIDSESDEELDFDALLNWRSKIS